MPPRPLDVRIDELRAQPDRSWGVLDAVLAVVAVPLVALAFAGLVGIGLELPEALTLVVATLALCGLAALVGRRAARQSGGWDRALGLELPEWPDAGRIVVWTVLLLLAQAGLLGVLSLLPPLQGVEPESNVGFLSDRPLWLLLLFAVLTVTVTPVVEEVLFRGVALRGLMMQLGFWPAAVLSSAFFALLHVPELALGSLYLLGATGMLGLALCVLTRRSGSLGPAIGVHALHNAAVFVFTVATGS
jgi:uncharacterized protein